MTALTGIVHDMESDPEAADSVSSEQQSPTDLRRERREMWARDIARTYPTLVGRAQLSDPLSREVREGGWGPDTLSAEALLGRRFHEASPGAKAAYAYLSMATIAVLSLPGDAAFNAVSLMAQQDRRHLDVVGLVMDQRRNATHPDMDPRAALADRLVRTVDDLREQGLPADSRQFGWFNGEMILQAQRLYGEWEKGIGNLALSLCSLMMRARMCLVGDSRDEILAGADETGYVMASIRKCPRDEQALYRYLAAGHLMELLPDGRTFVDDLPRRAAGWISLTPEALHRMTRRLRVDPELLLYFEQEIQDPERRHYQVIQPTEMVIGAGGIERLVIFPSRPYWRRLPPAMHEQARAMTLTDDGTIEAALPAEYLPLMVEDDRGGRDFGALIISHGVGPDATTVETPLVSTAERLFGAENGGRLGHALRCLAVAIYRDLIVPDVREAHYVRRDASRAGAKKSKARQAEPRPRLLPRVVYEGRERVARQRAGEPMPPRLISPHIRRLGGGSSASDAARARATEWNIPVPNGYTFVAPFFRPRPADEAELAKAEKELERPVWRSWSAYDLLIGS